MADKDMPYTAPPAVIRAGADALVRMRSNGAYRLDALSEQIQDFWLHDAATVLTAAGRLLEAAALRSYADRHHHFADGHGPIWPAGGGDPIDAEAYCACGASWSEDDDDGCPERTQLLDEAAALERGSRDEGNHMVREAADG